MAKILHIIETLSGAGPTRSLQALVEYLDAQKHEHEHLLLTLNKPNYPPALLRARKAGIGILQAPGSREIREQVERADIVQVHYWNNPAFMEFLCTDLPPHRRLAWFKILGRHAPQVISTDLLEVFDAAMVSSPVSLQLPAFKQLKHLEGLTRVVPGLMEPGRLHDVKPAPHEGFNVSYIGTANATKMHPDFVSMSASARLPGVRFIVCGPGDSKTLLAQASELNAAGKFDFQGYRENIKPVLEISDVFGYPLCEDTWATSEKSLQEAMLAAVPPVVFPHGGVASIVRHGETGLVVHSAKEYAEALEYLQLHPEERRRLGRNARDFILSHFDGPRLVQRVHGLYEKMMERPPRRHRPLGAGTRMDERFATMMLPANTAFRDSLKGNVPEAFRADRLLASASMPVAQGEGGIVQFRNAYPESPIFCLWSGLVLTGKNQWEKALTEFRRAWRFRQTGEGEEENWRIAWYLAVAHSRVASGGDSEGMFASALEHARTSGLTRTHMDRLGEEATRNRPEMFPF